jgi:hypothetical protein
MRTRTRSAHTAASVAVPHSSGTPELKRRRFLFTLGLGGAAMGAAASVSASVSTLADATVAPAEESPDGRYRETEHVRDYYRTAKL